MERMGNFLNKYKTKKYYYVCNLRVTIGHIQNKCNFFFFPESEIISPFLNMISLKIVAQSSLNLKRVCPFFHSCENKITL